MSDTGRFSNTFRHDARAILRFAGPLAVNNLVLAGMMLTNTVMAGRLGSEPLAGVAVGGSYYQIFWLFGLGILMSISPIVAHAYGAGRDREVGRHFRQGLWLSQMLAVPLVGGLAVRRAGARAGSAPIRARFRTRRATSTRCASACRRCSPSSRTATRAKASAGLGR